MANRAAQVMTASARAGRLARAVGAVDAVLARNLEMLSLGAAVRGKLPRAVPLSYEVLDIHRLLLDRSVKGRALREVERRLAANVSAVITSSPAFVRQYFEPLSGVRAPVHLVENKVPGWAAPPPSPRLADGPPWRIGLFGALRDRRSVDLLKQLAATLDGLAEIVVRGRPSAAIFDDLAAELAAAPNVAFEGAYRNPDDLAAIYADVHFVWAIDYYEADANSEWLLPNRLYEGGLYGAVPIARQGTEIARFLADRDYGLVLGADPAEALADRLRTLDGEAYRAEAAKVARVPTGDFVADDGDCAALVALITGAMPRVELAA
ncbi:glycosyl transferase family 1 [Acuticoccus sp. M5D2P5]|uniref:glycosyltransferase n=1 Tax=Acuticoccus kalidii TaxID=2910977 RepID=UPI001F432A69|nr:glycosyltransferase [Acuticoccus kalidii]MCF3931922.1 glycosyl transferase family 1 [Acuticoccus kalidii]